MQLFSHRGLSLVAGGLSLLLSLSACGPTSQPASNARPATIVVTTSLLGSLVKELVGDHFAVRVLMPNGLDPHEWEPSARDRETINHASLVVRNGLGLESGLDGALARAQEDGVPVFTASEHLVVRIVKAGQGLPTGDPDQAAGAQDPHLWLDPVKMKGVVAALAVELESRFGTPLGTRARELEDRLDALDREIKAAVQQIPDSQRLLVTGHESLGYWADAYGFTLVGAIVPGLTDQAEVSASDMASLKATIRDRKVTVLFTEMGTPPKVAQALGTDLGIRVVEITTHALPADGSYFSFMKALAGDLVSAMLER